MRPIKFRAWDKLTSTMVYFTEHFEINDAADGYLTFYALDDKSPVGNGLKDRYDLMQFTGLHDKNELKELYEGDIIDADGKLKGNIYESPQVYEEGIDCLIEGMGTEKWRNTESVAVGRGCKYSK